MTDRSHRSAARRPAPPRRAPGPRPHRPDRHARISPGAVILAIALGGSVAYVAYTITVRDASQIPLLASGAVVLGIAFAALAAYACARSCRPGRERRSGGSCCGPGRRRRGDRRGRLLAPGRSSCSSWPAAGAMAGRPPARPGRRRTLW